MHMHDLCIMGGMCDPRVMSILHVAYSTGMMGKTPSRGRTVPFSYCAIFSARNAASAASWSGTPLARKRSIACSMRR